MSTDILRERYGRLFNAYDANPDGYIAAEDMSAYAHKLAATRGYSPDAPALKDLLGELQSEWQMVATAADTNHDGRVNRDEFVGFAEPMRARLQYAVNANAPWPLDPWVNRSIKCLTRMGLAHSVPRFHLPRRALVVHSLFAARIANVCQTQRKGRHIQKSAQ